MLISGVWGVSIREQRLKASHVKGSTFSGSVVDQVSIPFWARRNGSTGRSIVGDVMIAKWRENERAVTLRSQDLPSQSAVLNQFFQRIGPTPSRSHPLTFHELSLHHPVHHTHSWSLNHPQTIWQSSLNLSWTIHYSSWQEGKARARNISASG